MTGLHVNSHDSRKSFLIYLKGIFSERNQVLSRCVKALWRRSYCSKIRAVMRFYFWWPFLFFLLPHPPAPPPVNLALQGFWLEREGTELGESRFSLFQQIEAQFHHLGTADLPQNVSLCFHLFSRLCFRGGAGTGLPFASPFQTCVRFSDSPQPKPWAPLEAASLDSVAQTQPWPEPSCCFMLLYKGCLN